jgi:hypothetical protein
MEEKKKKAELPKAVAKKEKEGNLSASEPPPKAEAKKGTNFCDNTLELRTTR